MSPEKITSNTTTNIATEYKVQIFDYKKNGYTTIATYSAKEDAMEHAERIHNDLKVIIVRDKTIAYQTTYSMPVATINNKL